MTSTAHAADLLLAITDYIDRPGGWVTADGVLHRADIAREAHAVGLDARGFVEIFTDYTGRPYMVRPTHRGWLAASRLQRLRRA